MSKNDKEIKPNKMSLTKKVISIDKRIKALRLKKKEILAEING